MRRIDAIPPSARTVLIPLAGFGSEGGRIARVHADTGTPGRNPANLKPQIAELADWQLYEAGAIALGSVKRLNLKPKAFGLSLCFDRGAVSGHLTVTNGPDLLGLSPENGQSAELGLALALLMHAAQSRDHLVIATGHLSRDTAPGAVPTEDVSVLPVGELPRKFAVLREALDAQKGSAYAQKVLFFLPASTLEGAETATTHARDLQALREAYLRKGVEIEVCPIASLRAALDKLRIEGLAPREADRWLGRAAAAALFVLIVTTLGYAWLAAPLDLAFGSIKLATGEKIESPIRSMFDIGKKAFVTKPACLGPQRVPIYQVGESLIFRAVLRNGSRVAASLAGYHYIVVGVSEHSGLKVFPPETFGRQAGLLTSAVRAAPKAVWELSAVIPIDGPTERNKIIIMARKLRPFDSGALRKELEALLADKPVSERINTAVAYLSARVPGYLDYSFLSTEGNAACEPS